MPRGRPPKHPEIRRLEGNPGHRPIPEPVFVPSDAPWVPEHLSDDAQACMDVIQRSMPPGTYAACDTYMLSAFATAWSVHKRAVEALQREPLVVKGSKGGQVRSPWLAIASDQARLMASLGARLYLDPVSRLGLRPPAERLRSKFEGLLGTPDPERWRQ
jgi:P27 family predicted phage terminase small subunit